jgi:hypothetical protein
MAGAKSLGKQQTPQNAPDAIEVDQFHVNADTDIRPESVHHTLGPGNTQGSPGNHIHDGGNSPLILSGFTVSGSRGGNVALVSVISQLVRLGATDQSVP